MCASPFLPSVSPYFFPAICRRKLPLFSLSSFFVVRVIGQSILGLNRIHFCSLLERDVGDVMNQSLMYALQSKRKMNYLGESAVLWHCLQVSKWPYKYAGKRTQSRMYVLLNMERKERIVWHL